MENKEQFGKAVYDLLIDLGISDLYVEHAQLGILVVTLALIGGIADSLSRRMLLALVNRFAEKSKTDIDDVLVEHHVFRKIAHLVPAFIVAFALPYIFHPYPFWEGILLEAVDVYIIVNIILAVQAILKSGNILLRKTEFFNDKPVESYTQLLNIFNYVFGGLFIFSELTGNSIITFLTAIGAASAVLILTFKDTILGFVASIQLSANDMVKVGDWISFEQYGADGDVLEINLTTVKVKNWDNTVTTIPTYSFISDAFKNWRHMQESGGRRIKRSIHIKLSSIRFVQDSELDKYRNIQLIQTYVDNRKSTIDSWNEQNQIDKSNLLNGRNMTNLGLFRKFVHEYLEQHPAVNRDLTYMVRQLQPDEFGIPLEVYCFCKDKQWENYEYIQGDMLDYLLSSVPYFDLEVHERPSSKDIQSISS